MYMVRAFGGNSSRRLVFGFMCASAFLSMWISNTSTTLMLLPVALAALEKSDDAKLAAPLLLEAGRVPIAGAAQEQLVAEAAARLMDAAGLTP